MNWALRDVQTRCPRSALERGSRSWLVASFIILFSVMGGVGLQAAEARIAVAANFRDTALAIAQQLEATSVHRYEIISGSTGKLAAQIINGAPFDVLMAADIQRPRELKRRGLIVAESLQVYAIGELGLWWPRASGVVTANNLIHLEPGEVGIANPAFAPYGAAAWRVMEDAQMPTEWLSRVIRVDNVNLVTGLLVTGQVKAGFVARSSITAGMRTGSLKVEPEDILWFSDRASVEQALVIISRARDNEAAQFWVSQMQAPVIREVIRADGYRLPDRVQD